LAGLILHLIKKTLKEYMRMNTHLLHSSQLESHSKRDCSACPIRHNAICSRCQPDELDALDQMKTYRIFEKGEAITHIGENIAYVGTLVSGVAAISKSLEDGRKQILGILLPSDFVGRPGHPVSSYDVVAETPVEMCRFPIASFEKLLNQSPALGPRLLEKPLMNWTQPENGCFYSAGKPHAKNWPRFCI
jgi:CRP/FNR family transcriptional regulator